jgi:hypothetical protein
MTNSIYRAIAWKAMELFEKEDIPFCFVPVKAYKTKQKQKRVFSGDHHDSGRIILYWLFLQLKKRHMIQDQNVFDLAEHLQQFLPELIDERWEESKWNGNFSMSKVMEFNYPVYPFELDNFSINVKEITKRIDEGREKFWKSQLPVFPTFALNKEDSESENTGEYWQVPKKKAGDDIDKDGTEIEDAA